MKQKLLTLLAVLLTALTVSAQNYILYTSTDGEVVAPNPSAFSSAIVSNTYEDGLGRIEFDGTLLEVGFKAFNGRTTLATVELPWSVSKVGDKAFQDCANLTSAKLPGVREIEHYAFSYCTSLTTVEMPYVMSLGIYAFNHCFALTAAEMPRLTNIEQFVFNQCTSLTSVEIPDGVKKLGMDSFSGCSNLTTVVLGRRMAEIGSRAFKTCYNLKEITILNPTPPSVNVKTNFIGLDASACTLKVPAEAVEAYQTSEYGWNIFNIVGIDATGINSAEAETNKGVAYSLSGSRVGEGYKGIVIRNGKKVVRR